MMLWFLILPTFLLVYGWLVYPGLLAVLARARKKRRVLEPPTPGRSFPGWVAVVLTAYNEEKVIAERARNLIESCQGLAERQGLRILIGVDGATDRTAEAARLGLAGCTFGRVMEFATRRGKTAVLKDLVAIALNEGRGGEGALVFTDANTRFLPGSVERLLSALSLPGVGGVSGRLIFRKKEASDGSSEPIYWDLETKLKTWESALDSCLGANGAIYAIRSSLFWREIPSDTIVEDFVIGMKAREQGWRMVYKPEAVAEEDLPPAMAEWRRRIRIGTGDFQALTLCRRCLHPRMGLFAWCFWSHKVLRWFTPHLLLALLFGVVMCAGWGGPMASGAALFVLGGFSIWFGLAILGSLFERSSGRSATVLRPFWYAIMIQTAIFWGFVRFLSGRVHAEWEPTPRQDHSKVAEGMDQC